MSVTASARHGREVRRVTCASSISNLAGRLHSPYLDAPSATSRVTSTAYKQTCPTAKMELEGSGNFTALFTFESGEALTLKQHYATLGAPQRDAVSALTCR